MSRARRNSIPSRRITRCSWGALQLRRLNLVGCPPLPLKVDDISLQEHGAPVAEFGHTRGLERAGGVLIRADAERSCRGLTENSRFRPNTGCSA